MGEPLTIWRMVDRRGLGFHGGWSVGTPYSHLEPDEVEVVEVLPASSITPLLREIDRIEDCGHPHRFLHVARRQLLHDYPHLREGVQ